MSKKNPRRKPPKPPNNYKLTGKAHNAPSPTATAPTFALGQGGAAFAIASVSLAPVLGKPTCRTSVTPPAAAFTVPSSIRVPEFGLPKFAVQQTVALATHGTTLVPQIGRAALQVRL